MSTHNLYPERGSSESSHLHRIGGVSRLAGVPVSTLRMWESRYGAFTPRKSQGQHRLYADADVVRARLLRQLTESGHSIGGIAALPAARLQQLVAESHAADARRTAPAGPRRLSLVVVGAAVAARLGTPAWRSRLGGDLLELRQVYADLDEALQIGAAAAADDAAPAEVLLVRLNAVQPATPAQLVALRTACQARHGVLLYNFGAEATLARMREAGFIVRRQPVDDAELADLLRSVTWAAAPAHAVAALPARRFDDAELARVAASPSRMLCECPRHIAEIIGQLASFEDYSAECLNESEQDAQVHAQLRSVAGSARALFEDALAMVIAHNAAREAAAGA